MNDKGFVKLHREIINNPIVSKDVSSIAVWIHLITNAAYQETEVLFNGKYTILKDGQLLTTEKEICDKLKLKPSKVHRILSSFINEGLIEKQTSNKNTLITVYNCPSDIKNEKRNEKPVNNQRKTNGKSSYYKRKEEKKKADSGQDDSAESWIRPNELEALIKGESNGTL